MFRQYPFFQATLDLTMTPKREGDKKISKLLEGIT